MHYFSTKFNESIDCILNFRNLCEVPRDNDIRCFCKAIVGSCGNEKVFDLSRFGCIHAEFITIITNCLQLY